jgi:hypothetical protein
MDPSITQRDIENLLEHLHINNKKELDDYIKEMDRKLYNSKRKSTTHIDMDGKRQKHETQQSDELSEMLNNMSVAETSEYADTTEEDTDNLSSIFGKMTTNETDTTQDTDNLSSIFGKMTTNDTTQDTDNISSIFGKMTTNETDTTQDTDNLSSNQNMTTNESSLEDLFAKMKTDDTPLKRRRPVKKVRRMIDGHDYNTRSKRKDEIMQAQTEKEAKRIAEVQRIEESRKERREHLKRRQEVEKLLEGKLL